MKTQLILFLLPISLNSFTEAQHFSANPGTLSLTPLAPSGGRSSWSGRAAEAAQAASAAAARNTNNFYRRPAESPLQPLPALPALPAAPSYASLSSLAPIHTPTNNAIYEPSELPAPWSPTSQLTYQHTHGMSQPLQATPSHSIFTARSPTHLNLPAQVSWFYSDKENAIYKVARINLDKTKGMFPRASPADAHHTSHFQPHSGPPSPNL